MFFPFSCFLFFILSSWVSVNTLELVEFTSAEAEALEAAYKKSHPSRDSAVELVSFTEEEEAALRRGWKGAKNYRGGKGVPTGQSRISPEEYCGHYRANYAYYCIGTNYGSEPLVMKIAQFCPTYKSKCMVQAKTVETDPFNVLQPRVSPDFPDVEGKARDLQAEQRAAALKAQYPCTRSCNQRIFPHCTQDCKCDYEYPRVQRFCNPPPMPFFLNTCRLWYYSCPKYSQYHYSSQFVYSKAEKGKTIGGVAPGVAGVGSPAAAVVPGSTAALGGGMPDSGMSSSSMSASGTSGMGFGMSSGSGVSTPFGGFGMGTSFGVG